MHTFWLTIMCCVASVSSNLVYKHITHKAMGMSSIHPFAKHEPHVHSRVPARPVTTTQLSEQQAAVLLGYTQVSWDNASGKEAQPASASKKWTDLTGEEKSAATVSGYTESTWRTVSATKKTPWSDLAVTIGEGVCCVAYWLFNNHCRVLPLHVNLACKHVAHKS